MVLVYSILSLTVTKRFDRDLCCTCFDVANAKFTFTQDALRPRCLLIQFTPLHLHHNKGDVIPSMELL